MKKLKKLTLNKSIVANLGNDELNQLKGGGFTSGCTDGCTTSVIGQSYWNCTNTNCTNDCYGSGVNTL
ncbi:TIGR04149 family rSAM-modified RiPP [Dysgonomonas sp. ZJ279]|uniref:TIGR04149 family rSAM-modified RiPP n=1 Tax=Dysgonomonas sp. ZJ279 TaxID=2709796 RepID=UPI0013EAE520|nr:TIGR04149 family rSAM-modified RiPP [Dysgonomonas sp. ZJ279]